MNIQDDTHSSTSQALSYLNFSCSINNSKMAIKDITRTNHSLLKQKSPMNKEKSTSQSS